MPRILLIYGLLLGSIAIIAGIGIWRYGTAGPVAAGSAAGAAVFDPARITPHSFEADFMAAIRQKITAELQGLCPDLPPEKLQEIAVRSLALETCTIPAEAARSRFLDFLLYQQKLENLRRTPKMHQEYLTRALALAAQYPDDPDVARFVFRRVCAAESALYLEDGMLRQYNIHPCLKLLLQGGRALQTGWKARGGGFIHTVSGDGLQGFHDNLKIAGTFFEDAWRQYPQFPEAAAEMIGIAGAAGGADDMDVWLGRALGAQADYRQAISHYAWYMRPRWGGSTAELYRRAKAFLALHRSDPRMAQNGIFLLQTWLSEKSVIDTIRYFAGSDGYPEIRSIFEQLTPLDSSQKCFYGTAALFAGDWETARRIYDGLTAADKAFTLEQNAGAVPSIFWLDFVRLYPAMAADADRRQLLDALTGMDTGQRDMLLRERIRTAASKDTRDALLELYLALNADIDWLDYRHRTPVFSRLCYDPGSNMLLIKEAIALGVDLEQPSGRLPVRPLFFALRYGKNSALFDLLIASGADPNGLWGSHTPLAYMTRYKFEPEKIRMLLKAGADPNRKFQKSFVPLHVAISNLEAARALIEAGADPNVVSHYGQTPLDLARKYGTPEVVEYLRSNGAKYASEL